MIDYLQGKTGFNVSTSSSNYHFCKEKIEMQLRTIMLMERNKLIETNGKEKLKKQKQMSHLHTNCQKVHMKESEW